MLRIDSLLIVVLLVWLPSVGFSGGQSDKSKESQQLYFSVLEAQLVAIESGEYRTMDRVFELERTGEDADSYLVDLLDYHLGAGASETLLQFIVRGGDRFVRILNTKRMSQLGCLPRYRLICVDSIDERNRMINKLLEEIKERD